MFYFDGANHQSSTRLSVKVADESQFNLVTQFVGAQTDGDSELISIHQGDYDVGNMAELNHWNIQEYSQKQYFLDRHYFHCHESSRVEQRNIHRGALHGQQRSYAQVDKEAYFEARSACELNSKQHIDLWFHNRHSDKSSVSDTSAHCVMRGESSVVFNGMIEITPKGEFTRAYQSHKTLMLSDNASVKSIPQLEIATDDVKCSHGASTSYLESDQLFYLQSRGFSKKEAEDCIAEAFTKNIYDNSPSVFVNKYLDKKQDAED